MWRQLRGVLPIVIEDALKGVRETVSEIRIRRNKLLCVTVSSKERMLENRQLGVMVTDIMMDSVVEALCNHSVYSHTDTIREGYIVYGNGIRIGTVGRAVCEGGFVKYLSSIDGLNIRLPVEIFGIGRELFLRMKRELFRKSYLVYSAPAMGKTTILRDIIADLCNEDIRVAVVDTRREIETERLSDLSHLDILSGYPRGKGIEIATRTLSPQYIVCDEIGSFEEAESLVSAQNSGVPILATAHAASVVELLRRRNIGRLHEAHLFSEYVGIKRMIYGKAPHFLFTDRNEIG